MSEPEIACPVCHRLKFTLPHPGAGRVVCPCSKKKQIRFHRYPAYVRKSEMEAALAAGGRESGWVEGESTCFHHPERTAVAACADCGVFVCRLCETSDRGTSLCLSCFTKRQQSDLKLDVKKTGSKRIVYDNLAVALALLPMMFFWATLVTAPAALFVVIRYWRSHPCSVVPRTRFRFVFAGAVALLQMTGWVFFFVALMENAV